MNLITKVFHIVLALSIVISVSFGDDYDQYDSLKTEKFRMRRLNVIWDEALKHLKGQKLKSFLTELKTHEKLALSLKKKRHTDPDTESDLNTELLQLEKDLEKIVTRYHLSPSIIPAREGVKPDHDESINSVLSTKTKQSQKSDDFDRYQEHRSLNLYHQLQDLSGDVFRSTDESNEGKRRRKSFEEFVLQFERDLDIFESRLKKVRYLENELDRIKSKDRVHHHYDKKYNQEDMEFNNFGAKDDNVDDVKRRLKDMTYKSTKLEKELIDRLIERRKMEFPTSRSEGEL